MRVFLSYRREDASGHAGRLYDLLAARYGNERVFMDIDAIPLGSEFRTTIDSAVSSCDVLIALIGRSWVSATDSDGRRRLEDPDDFVRREIESALSHDVVVVPTCVQGASMPRTDELPASLAPLAGRQGFELRDAGWQDDVGRLTKRLEQVASERAGGKPPTMRARRRRAPAQPAWWRRGPFVAALGVLVVAGVALAVALSGDGGGSDDGGQAPSSKPERQLLAMIPEGTRPDCQRRSEPEARAEASLSCGVASTLTAEYFLFPSRGVAHDWYIRSRIEADVDPNDGNCTEGKFRGEASYGVDGRLAGKYFCLVQSDDTPALAAVDERAKVGIAVTVYRGKGKKAVQRLIELWDCCIPVKP